ncbi:MAG: proprotein convertase P-domain-containing protein [Saprospiraceae bacterium]
MPNQLQKRLERTMLLGKMLFACFFLLVFPDGIAAQNACSCTNCPQYLPDNFQGNFYIQVQNAANNVLGENGQAVCGVTLHFEHDYISDILITLTSPAGQTVTLVGPLGLFGETDGTGWDITFVPCAQQANPDPGFSSGWSNNQNWGFFGNYTGSYYPVTGCLEDFNSGPVNGQWTLTVTDGLNNDVGNFYDYSIIFCDDTGIECISCEAGAGNLLMADIVACAGNASLDLDLLPSYTPPQTPPPANAYSYVYVIAVGGVILAYQQEPDLQNYPPGSYTVCGLSYLTSDSSDIPAPNGTLTLAQLNTQLNSPTPPFCGKITSNCVNVTIQAALPDVEDFETICAPDCFEYFDSTFCSTGDHTLIVTQDNCDFNATLHLNVLQPVRDTVYETICRGDCALTSGFENRCESGTYSINYSGANGCDSIATLILDVLAPVATIAPPPVLHCDQTGLELDGTGSSAGSGIRYLWTATAGGHIAGPDDEATVLIDSAGTYRLEVCSTSAGISCCDTAYVQVLSEQIPPATPDTILGPAQLCFGQTGVWQIDSIPGATAYSWTIPAGVGIISGLDSATITLAWSMFEGDSICVAAINACGTGVPACLEIQVTDTLAPPVSLTGSTLACLLDTIGYRAKGSTGSNTFQWEVPANALITNGQGTDSLSLVWVDHPGGAICVRELNNCDTSAAICIDVSTIQPPAPVFIEGPDTVCAATKANYSIEFATGSEKYTWSVDGGGLLGNPGSEKIQVHWSDPGTTGKVCVQARNICGDSSLSCKEVFILNLPDAYAGKDTAVCGLNVKLNAILSDGAHSGEWNFISGPGTAIFNEATAPNTVVQVSLAGKYVFEWNEKSALCIQRDSISIEFNSIPTATAADPVCDNSNSFYTVNIVLSGGAPPYASNGVPIGANTVISDPIASGSGYAYLISDKNACTVQVSGSFTCACKTAAGNMDPTLLEVCVGENIVVLPPDDLFLDGNDTALFVLHTSAGNTLGQVFDQNTTGVFGWKPGLAPDSVYYISIVAGNNLNGFPDPDDPCFSIAFGQPVKFHFPPTPNAGEDSTHCGLNTVLKVTPGTSLGSWAFVSGPGVVSINGASASNALVQVSQPGEYLFSWTESAGKCVASDTVSIEFQEIPQIDTVQEICTGTNAVYFVQFNVSGGLPPYIVDGLSGIVNASFFLSNLLQNNSGYSFYIKDANGCISPEVSGTHSCACVTDAGTMDQTPKTFCENEQATGVYKNDGKTDQDDIISYILHDFPGDSPGTILAVNDQPVFPFLPGLKTGETYYISAIVGNNSNGQIDLDDPCLSVAAGTPVQWKPLPDALFWGDTTICAGEEALLYFQSNGPYPVSITYTDHSGQDYTISVTSNMPLAIPVAPKGLTVFTLQSIVAGTAPACAATAGDSVVINVHAPANAGAPLDTAIYCRGDSSTVHLNNLLSGEHQGGQWSEVSEIISVGNAFDAAAGTFNLKNQPPGAYAFTYRVEPQAPCLPDSATVNIYLRELPVSDAGEDAFLDCNTPVTTLGGPGTDTGQGYQYAWRMAGAGSILGADLYQQVTTSGYYILDVTDMAGCSNADTVEVVQLSAPIEVDTVSVVDIRCYGEKNGMIRVGGVSGGTPPVLFSLNGSPFSLNETFDRLGPGAYHLVAQDVGGCEWADTLILAEPPEIKIDLGPDIEAALGDSVYLWLQSSVTTGGLDTIIWEPLLDTARIGSFEQKWMPRHSGKIKVILIDTSGCVAVDEILLKLNRERRVYIPNVFNPGAENTLPFGISLGPDVERVEILEIFNRWGELVHSAKWVFPQDSSLDWDGTFRGRYAPPGVYLVYLIVHFKDGEKEIFTGTVTLLR